MLVPKYLMSFVVFVTRSIRSLNAQKWVYFDKTYLKNIYS